jgi:hypothetical protein
MAHWMVKCSYFGLREDILSLFQYCIRYSNQDTDNIFDAMKMSYLTTWFLSVRFLMLEIKN